VQRISDVRQDSSLVIGFQESDNEPADKGDLDLGSPHELAEIVEL
jgi:hypothetical protein